MKTTSTTQTLTGEITTGEITTISVDGETVARFFGSGSVEAAKQFNDAAHIAAENKRLREALEELAEDLSGRSANEFGLGNWITAEIFLDFATAARAALKGGAQ